MLENLAALSRAGVFVFLLRVHFITQHGAAAAYRR